MKYRDETKLLLVYTYIDIYSSTAPMLSVIEVNQRRCSRVDTRRIARIIAYLNIYLHKWASFIRKNFLITDVFHVFRVNLTYQNVVRMIILVDSICIKASLNPIRVCRSCAIIVSISRINFPSFKMATADIFGRYVSARDNAPNYHQRHIDINVPFTGK